jgi:hypothetical protein
VALICDFLKGNNEQLRELTIELKVRRDEGRRLFEMLTAPPMEIAEPVTAPQPKPVPDVAPVTASAPPVKNWDALLARNAETAKAKTHDGFPRGFHDGDILKRLSHQQVNGLVVSIGVNTSRAALIPGAVRSLVRSLLGPNDFACQSGADEFVLVYPGERGAAAHRRLSQISQQLWKFQLGTMGTDAIVFSWGGMEVRGEELEEAVASANERMQDTRRGRKLLMMRPALKQAV